MSLPEYTKEQKDRWMEGYRKDKNIPAFVLNHQTFIDILLAGSWLTEYLSTSLPNPAYDAEDIRKANFAFGQMAVYSPPGKHQEMAWKVIERFLAGERFNDPEALARKLNKEDKPLNVPREYLLERVAEIEEQTGLHVDVDKVKLHQ